MFDIKYTQAPVGPAAAKEFAQRTEALALPRRTTVERVLISAAGAEPEVTAGGGFDRVLALGKLLGRA